jgi:hypothetical protein
MELTGIQIVVNGVEKFVGKLGACPKNPVFPGLLGRPVFYREVPFSDVYSYETRALGVDRDAWDKAVEMGAEGMVIYCADRSECYYVSAKLMAAEAFIVDLGEFPQYRISLRSASCRPASRRLRFGYTTNVITVGMPADGYHGAGSDHHDTGAVQFGLF